MDPTPNPADHQQITHADEQPPREIKYRRNPKATQPAAVLIVRADEQLGDLYQQIAPVDHQHIAHADEQPPRVVSTLSPKATEADDALIARADERLRHAYEQIARADEQLSHVAERLSRLEQDDARQSLAVPSPRTSRGRPALRGLIGLVLAACIISGAFVWQSSSGDPAKLMIARWMPQLVSTSSLPLRPRSSADQVIAAEPTSPQSTPSAQTAPQELAPKPAPLPPELEQFKTSPEMMAMARDNAKAIEQLKTSQEQMARDNAKVIAQLKEQMTSLFARPSEQNARPKIPTPPPRPVVTPTR